MLYLSFFSKCNFSIEKTSVLQGVTSLPYDILFREQPHCSALVDLIPSVTALLSDGRKVRKLISSMLQTLQQVSSVCTPHTFQESYCKGKKIISTN